MESKTTNNVINAMKEVRELFSGLKSNYSHKETKKIRKELYKKETVYNFLKEKDSLTNKQKIVLKNINKYFNKFKKDFKKLQKYQDNITYGLDYLFNEFNEEDYMLYESKGDKDDKIKSYLKGMIDDCKSKGEWKMQLVIQIIFFLS